MLGALSVMIHSITTLPMLCVGSWVTRMQSAGTKQTELSSKQVGHKKVISFATSK